MGRPGIAAQSLLVAISSSGPRAPVTWRAAIIAVPAVPHPLLYVPVAHHAARIHSRGTTQPAPSDRPIDFHICGNWPASGQSRPPSRRRLSSSLPAPRTPTPIRSAADAPSRSSSTAIAHTPARVDRAFGEDARARASAGLSSRGLEARAPRNFLKRLVWKNRPLAESGLDLPVVPCATAGVGVSDHGRRSRQSKIGQGLRPWTPQETKNPRFMTQSNVLATRKPPLTYRYQAECP